MQSCHADQVARLHMENLQTYFRGWSGRELLSLYYVTLVKERGGCGYVAVSQDELVGFVCGVWDAHELRKTLLRAHWLRLVFWGMLQLVSTPSLIFDFIARFRSDKPVSAMPEETDGHGLYELRPIVVASKMRGNGLGFQLVERLMEDARSRGYHMVYLYTEDDNLTAQRFYEKTGFKEFGRRFMNGKHYLCFKLDISWMRTPHES